MYCQDCNTHNSLDSKYCKECGAKINSGYRTLMLSIQDLPLHQSDEDVEKLTRLLDMAFWHNQAGNQAAAITACQAALALNPNSTTAHSLLGTLYEKSGDDAQAIQHFEAVLSLNPDSQADAAKLEQLRRGVHVRAAAPPISHQWLPPAFLKLGPQIGKRFAELSAAPLAAGTASSRRPLYAAGGATALVLVAGLLLTHPWASAETVKTYPITTPAAPMPIVRSAFAPGSQVASATAPPMVLTPSRANIQTPTYVPPLITSRDPFTGPVPASNASAGLSPYSLPAVPRRTAAVRRTGRGIALPPLRLAALPPVGAVPGGIAPAPVSIPDEGVSLPAFAGSALTAAVPRHTVIVGGYSGSSAPSASPFQSDLSSHIRITVHQSRDTDGAAAPAAADSLSSSDGGQGETYQQRALTLQEAGSYVPAKQAYQSAIRSYQAQIAAGRDVETAKRGLSACQTGLQICQQSQP